MSIVITDTKRWPHLQVLEAESIISCEAAASFGNPALSYSVGKDRA